MRRKILHFKSHNAYMKWLAYDKMNVDMGNSKRPVAIVIHGRPHRVNHGRKKR